MQRSNNRQRIFLWVVLGAVALAISYTVWSILRASAIRSQMQSAPIASAQPEELQAVQNGPHLIYLRQQEQPYGQVSLRGLDLSGGMQTSLRCDRIHYAADTGLCLIYDTSAAAQDPLAPAQAQVVLFGPDFQPRHQTLVEGIPSRTRVSADGKYAAYTVFVTGHSYTDANLSTATVILDTATGESIGNLEDFETWKAGELFLAPEFNFWGVTFAGDSNTFYATLRYNNTTYLVQGDIAARQMTVLHENVECPSLSPDGTRVAFKKLLTNRWQLTVLDLATMQETTLAEPEGIDDQVEWLDNDHILYQKADYDPPKWVSVFVLPADGSGRPEVFLENATSPVVVRE